MLEYTNRLVDVSAGRYSLELDYLTVFMVRQFIFISIGQLNTTLRHAVKRLISLPMLPQLLSLPIPFLLHWFKQLNIRRGINSNLLPTLNLNVVEGQCKDGPEPS